MPARKRPSPSRRKDTYWHRAQRPLNCLFFVLPLLVFYQVGAAIDGPTLLAPRHLYRVLRYFGAAVPLLPPALIIAVLLAQHVFRKDPWTVQPRVLAGMFGEAAAWTIPLIAVAYLRGQAAAGAAAETGSGFQELVTHVGAGVYEEFLFRLVLVGLLLLLFVDVFDLPEHVMTGVVVVFSAVLFALYHPPVARAPLGAFPWGTFLTLAAHGLLWGILYVFRGFGIAVGSHVVWNMYVLLVR
jgi:hypothetical protein